MEFKTTFHEKSGNRSHNKRQKTFNKSYGGKPNGQSKPYGQRSNEKPSMKPSYPVIVKRSPNDPKTYPGANFDKESIQKVLNQVYDSDLSVYDKIEEYIKVIKDIFIVKGMIVRKIKAHENNVDVFEFIKKTYGLPLKLDDGDIHAIRPIVFDYSGLFLEYKKNQGFNKIYKSDFKYNHTFTLDSHEVDLSFNYLVKHIWDNNFWLSLLPRFKFQPEHVTLDFINVLLCLYVELTRCQNVNCKKLKDVNSGTENDIVWERIDRFTNSLLQCVNYENVSSDNYYNLLTTLTSGEITFYTNVKSHIYTCFSYHSEIKDDKILIDETLYKLFMTNKSKYMNLIKINVFNFLADPNPLELKIDLGGRFSDGDDLISLVNKICNLIRNRSDRMVSTEENNAMKKIIHNYLMLYKSLKTHEYEPKVYDEDAKELFKELEFRSITAKQTTPLNCLIMNVLSDYFYSDRIKIKITTPTKVFDAFDNLMNKVVEELKEKENEIIRCDEINSFLDFFLGKKKNDPPISISYLHLKTFADYGLKDFVMKNKLKLHKRVVDHFDNPDF